MTCDAGPAWGCTRQRGLSAETFLCHMLQNMYIAAIYHSYSHCFGLQNSIVAGTIGQNDTNVDQFPSSFEPSMVGAAEKWASGKATRDPLDP
jgi:hypothetical protein